MSEDTIVQSHDTISDKQSQNVIWSGAQGCVGSNALVRRRKRGRSFKDIEAGKSKVEKKEKLPRQPAKRSKLSTAESRTIPRRSLRPRRRIISSPTVDDAEDIIDLSSDTNTEPLSPIDMQTRCRQNPSIGSFSAAGAKSDVGAEYREWPIKGHLKCVRIGGQSNYTIGFTLGSAHQPQTDDDRLQFRHGTPYATHNQAERSRVRSHKSYEVERVLDKHVSSAGHVQYLVRWKDYGPEFDEWIPTSAMNKANELVEDYERQAAPPESYCSVSKTPRKAERVSGIKKRSRGKPRDTRSNFQPRESPNQPKRGRGRGRPRKVGSKVEANSGRLSGGS